jgi:hypothetical protein
MTIEHIAPQGRTGPAAGTPEAAIGNLILVSEDLNQKLKDRKFAEKKTILQDAGVPLDEQIAGAAKWDKEEIIGRSRYLAKLSHSQVWSF